MPRDFKVRPTVNGANILTGLTISGALNDAVMNPSNAESVATYGLVWDATNSLWRRAAGDSAGRRFVSIQSAPATRATASLSTATSPAAPTAPGSNTTGIAVAVGSALYAVVDQAGTFGAGTTLTWQVSYDGGTQWYSQLAARPEVVAAASLTLTPGANGQQVAVIPVAGATHLRVYLSAAPASGAVAVGITLTQQPTPHVQPGTSPQTVGNIGAGVADTGNPVKVGAKYNLALPTYTDGQRADMQANANGLLRVDASGVAVPVTGTFWQATQPVSIAATVAVDSELPAAAALADAAANPTAPTVGAANEVYNGATWDRVRSLDAVKTAAAAPDVGIPAIGLAERRFASLTLATAANSTQQWDTEGAAEAIVEVASATTGTFLFEVSADAAGTAWSTAETWDATNQRALNGVAQVPAAGTLYRINTGGHRLLRVRTVTTLGATVGFVSTLSPFVHMPIRIDTGQGRTLQFAAISAAASGNNTLVAAAATGLKIKVVSYVLVADGTVTATFQSGAGGAALSGAMALVANSGVSAIGQPSSHLMETAAATLLNLSLGGAVGVRGHLSYFVEA